MAQAPSPLGCEVDSSLLLPDIPQGARDTTPSRTVWSLGYNGTLSHSLLFPALLGMDERLPPKGSKVSGGEMTTLPHPPISQTSPHDKEAGL